MHGHPARATRLRPLAVDHTLRERLGSVRLVLSGSAPLAAAVIDEFTAATGIAVHQGYGLTEAAPVVTSTLCSQVRHHASVGAALPGIEIRLIDDRGHPPDGEDPGEIQVRAPTSSAATGPTATKGPDAEGWWATGDVGFLDPSGDLFLVDRLKELVIVSGFNVYPIEVEDVIREVDGVAEVAVIGVEDEHAGEAVVAYVRAPGGDPAAVEAAVRSRCEERLAGFKRPSRVEVVDELPLTVTGKVAEGPAARPRAAPRARHPGVSAVAARVTLYSRPGCHLCDDARAVIERVCAELGEALRRGRHRRRRRRSGSGSARRSR